MPTTDAVLARRAAAGDQTAFERLYSNHSRRIQSVIYRRLGNWDDTQDVVQTTFLRAYLGLANFRQDATFSTWLTRIALNACTNHQRGRASARRWISAVEDPEMLPGALSRSTWDRDPERIAAARQELDLVLGTIQGLPDKYRQVMWLRHIEDLSYKEIRARLRVPMGSIKIRLFRARQLLASELRM